MRTPEETDAALRERAAVEIDVRHRLAQLGYGPLERSKLTHIEQRELLEGSIRAERRRRKRRAARMGVDVDKEEAKQEANDQMAAEMQAELDALDGGGGDPG